MVGLDHSSRDLDGLRHRHGLVSGCVELGVGCRDDTVRAARARGRSDAADCGVLSGVDDLDGRDGVGMGGGCVGGDEVF